MWRKRCGKCGQAVAVFMAAFLLAYNGSLMASQPVGPVNIEFIPANPTSTTPITVHVWGDWSDACVPQFAGFEILGHEIYLYFQGPNPGTICAQVITPWDASVPIGSLDPGNYLVSVLYCEPDPIEGFCIYTSLAEAKLRVIPEGPDIEASVTALYGSDPRPIVLFGEPAEVGEVVQAELDYGDGTSTAPFRDPLPDHPICAASGGFRNSDKTVISRLGISAGAGRDVLLVVDIAGSTGFQPGSAGYIRILNPEWRIVGVVAGDPRLNTDYAGFGVRIDPDQGYVEWYGRGGCPACACHENGMNFVLVLRRHPVMCEVLGLLGWHMVALPGELCPPCVYDGCGDVTCALCDDLDPCYIFYYDPDQGGYVMAPPKENICYHQGMGFWVRTYEPDVQVCVDVEVPTEDVTVPLAAAWNMIGNPFPFDVAVSGLRVRYQDQELPLLEAQAQGWVSAYLFGYDSVNGGYVVLDPEEGILEAWHGYWLRAYVECELIVPAEPAPSVPPAGALSPQDIERLRIESPPPPPNLPGLAEELRVLPIPNPVRDVNTATFRVLGICPCRVQGIRVEIYDLAGRLVWRGEDEGSMLTWHIKGLDGMPLANGVYLYKAYVKVENEWVPVGVQKVAVYR